MEQILNPNPNRRFNLVYDKKVPGKGFNASTGGVVETKAAAVSKNFNTNSFVTNASHAAKTYSAGDTGYDAGATKKKFGFLSWFQGKSYTTKAASGAKDFGGNKKYGDTAVTAAPRDFRGKERDKLNKTLTPEQAANNGYKGDLKEMKSIDDVRALLNKN